MNTNSKIILAAATGVAVGAILGILFAPDKGTETRKKLNEEGKKISDELKDLFEEARKSFDCLREDLEKMTKEKEEKLV